MNSLLEEIQKELCLSPSETPNLDDISVILGLLTDRGKIPSPDSLNLKDLIGLLSIEVTPKLIPENLQDALAQPQYLERVKKMLEERKNSNIQPAPCLRIYPFPLNREETDNLLGEDNNYGIIFGAESIFMQDTIHGIQNDALLADSDNLVNILGVHHDWLNESKLVTNRALFVDDKGLVKDVLFEEPVNLEIIHFLHLGYKKEKEIHRELSEKFKTMNIIQINPYGVSYERSDDKYRTYELLKSSGPIGLHLPETLFLPNKLKKEEIEKLLKGFVKIHKICKGIVLPNTGTEGELVMEVDLRNQNLLLECVNYIHDFVFKKDNGIFREIRGNTGLPVPGHLGSEYRRFTVRMHVSWNGEDYVTESGYGQIAGNDTTHITSLNHGGKVISFSEAFSEIHYESRDKQGNHQWIPYEVRQEDIEILKQSAEEVMRITNRNIADQEKLKFAGLDFLIEIWKAKDNRAQSKLRFTPVFLEINPRPAGLVHSRTLEHWEENELCITRQLFQGINSDITKQITVGR